VSEAVVALRVAVIAHHFIGDVQRTATLKAVVQEVEDTIIKIMQEAADGALIGN